MTPARRHKGLQMPHGERYALLPREVMESDAYRALPDSARTVLFGLLAQFHGRNNGQLALPWTQAEMLGISAQWKLYAGLKVLAAADLILCTRRGRLHAGRKLPSLYAVEWRAIDEPPRGLSYDGTIRACPIPSHRWANWVKPAGWAERCRAIARTSRGRKIPSYTTLRGVGRTTHDVAE